MRSLNYIYLEGSFMPLLNLEISMIYLRLFLLIIRVIDRIPTIQLRYGWSNRCSLRYVEF